MHKILFTSAAVLVLCAMFIQTISADDVNIKEMMKPSFNKLINSNPECGTAAGCNNPTMREAAIDVISEWFKRISSTQTTTTTASPTVSTSRW